MKLYFIISLILSCFTLNSHETRPSYLEIKQIEDYVNVKFRIPAKNDQKLAFKIIFPEDAEILRQEIPYFTQDLYVEEYKVKFNANSKVKIAGLDKSSTQVILKLFDDENITLLNANNYEF